MTDFMCPYEKGVKINNEKPIYLILISMGNLTV